MEWIGNIDIILQIIGGIVTVASLIASLTPSEKDDQVVSKVRKVLDRFSLIPQGTFRGKNGKPR